MPEMDQGIKRLIQTRPADVLALAVPGAEYLGPLPADVATEPQLVRDTLMHVRYHGIECAVDLEAEAQARRDIARRLFMSTEIIETSSVYQELVRRTREETAQQTLREAVLSVLGARFGNLPEDMVQALGGADADALCAFLPHAGTDTLEQLRTRLGL